MIDENSPMQGQLAVWGHFTVTENVDFRAPRPIPGSSGTQFRSIPWISLWIYGRYEVSVWYWN